MSITKHEDVYWTNRFGGRFVCEEHAREDEERRLSRPWHIVCCAGTEQHRPVAIEAIDDTKAPYTGQVDGLCRVWLFKDLIARYQHLMAQHGEMSGYTTHHCGMGNYLDEIVRLEPNPNHIQ